MQKYARPPEDASKPLFIEAQSSRSILWIMLLLVFAPHAAWATSYLDVSVALKTLLVMTDQMDSPVTVAIVYDEANPVSQADAVAIKSMIESGSEIPGVIELKPLMIPLQDLSGLHKARMAFLTDGMKMPAFDAVSRAARATGLLTVSTNPDCVKSGRCVLGITTRPSIEVYYSSAAAEAARVHFAPTFIMLARQV